jgi:energy-coupling factor transport system permease protein
MSYERRASPLHCARAAAGLAYCLALGCAALIISAPLVLGTITVAIGLAGVLAGVGAQMRRAAVFAAALGLVVMIVNALVTRNGLTVIWRLGELPVLGHVDVTLEATLYGAVLGLRAVALVLCGALYTLAVDPDEVLTLFRRISFRSALTATLATRMVPLLIRDSRRLADAQRCRAGRPATRLQLMRATTTGVLDRAVDAAAALEVRGYGAACKGPRSRAPYSRHDLAFLAASAALLGIVIGARIGSLAPFDAYPALRAPLPAWELALAAATLVCALLPFADRKGIER